MQVFAVMRGADKARRRFARLSPAVRGEVDEEGAAISADFFRLQQAGVPVARGVLRASGQRAKLAQARYLVSTGGGDAFHALFVDQGTKPGKRVQRYKRGSSGRRRPARMIQHPGTRGTGYHSGLYRQKRAEYRRRMKAAYRRAARRTR